MDAKHCLRPNGAKIPCAEGNNKLIKAHLEALNMSDTHVTHSAVVHDQINHLK